MTGVTVAQLIEHLRQFDPTLLVAYHIYSEQRLLKLEDVIVSTLQPPRADGWIPSLWGTGEGLDRQEYVLFPGN